jgi:ADP-ribose pyrophosphatase YjhB (NUDIX family)
MAHYCFQCGTQLELQLRDNREREVCPACDWVYYAQLKVGAAVIIEQNNRLLLLQRAHEPWVGSWMIPAGYVEADEDPKDAAKREVLEETSLVVELSELVKTYYFADDPRGNGISFVFRATKISGEMRINSEATAAQYFAPEEIPAYLTLGGHDKMIADWCASAKQKETSS